MDKNTVIMFDNYSSEAKQIFDNNLKTETGVIVQTATEENLISIEKNDTGAQALYIGDKRETQERVEINGGIYFSSTTFIEIIRIMSTSYTSNLEQNIDEDNKKGNSVITRVNANKIKRLNSLGIHPKKYENDIW